RDRSDAGNRWRLNTDAGINKLFPTGATLLVRFANQVVLDLTSPRPDIAISGDFIVGFPGETDTDFAATLALVEAIGYAQAFSFKYSPRPGTPAAELEDQIPDEVKGARLQQLQAVLGRQQQAFNAASSGKRCEVLLERRGRLPGQWIGKSPWLQSVVVSPPAAGLVAAGDMVQVELGRPGPNSIEGLMDFQRERAAS
ncbi:MAG: hypothetical protein ACK4TG_10045, partial [Thermaurantiacus sp.]